MTRKPALLLLALLGTTACPEEGVEPPAPVEVSRVSITVDAAVATILRVGWSQDAAADGWLEFDLGDGEWRTSPVTARDPGDHEEVILGAPAETDVQIRVVTDNLGERYTSPIGQGRTGALPEGMIEPTLDTWVPELLGPEEFVLGSVDPNGGEEYVGPFWLFIANRAGRVVWYREIGGWVTLFPRPSRDRTHIAWERHSLLDATGELSVLERATLDGRWTEEISLPGLGWAWDEMDDGTILYDVARGDESATLEEVAPDGTTRTVWDCTAWIEQWAADPDGCYTNTVNWSPERDTVMWSTYWGDWIAEVDRASGEVLWHAGELDGGWTIDAEAGLDLQHYPNYSPDGTLVVSTHVPGEDGEQRAREFVVDDSTQELREIWSYGEGVDGYAKYSGEAVRLANGNTLINYGTGGEIREVDLDGTTVWSLKFGLDRTLGHTQLLDDLYELNRGR